MKFLLKLLWRISVTVHSLSDNFCDWCSQKYTDTYWYEEVWRDTGKMLWRVDL